MANRKRTFWLAATIAPVVITVVGLPLFAAQQPDSVTIEPLPAEVVKWGFVAAAMVAGLAALGAAYAVAVVGAAAMGAVAEKPDTAGRALIFVGLAEGIAIYGLIIAIMILGKLT